MKKELKKGESFRIGYQQGKKDVEFELSKLQMETYKMLGREETIKQCLEIINRSVGLSDAYKEIDELLKSKK